MKFLSFLRHNTTISTTNRHNVTKSASMPKTMQTKRRQADKRTYRALVRESKRLDAEIKKRLVEMERRELKKQERRERREGREKENSPPGEEKSASEEEKSASEEEDVTLDGDIETSPKYCSRCRSWKTTDEFPLKEDGTLYAACYDCQLTVKHKKR